MNRYIHKLDRAAENLCMTDGEVLVAISKERDRRACCIRRRLVRELRRMGLSYPECAEAICRRNHSTIVAMCQRTTPDCGACGLCENMTRRAA